MLNQTTLMGRLVKDPELRRTSSGVAVASFRIAVDRDYAAEGKERETDFFDCVAWRGTGEFISKHFTKGRMIIATGRLETRSWTDKEGNKRYNVELNVENAYFGDSKKADNNQSAGGYAAPNGGYAAPNGGGYAAPNGGGYAAPNGGGYAAPNGGGYAAPNGGGYAAPNGGGYAAPNGGTPAQNAPGGFTPAEQSEYF